MSTIIIEKNSQHKFPQSKWSNTCYCLPAIYTYCRFIIL